MGYKIPNAIAQQPFPYFRAPICGGAGKNQDRGCQMRSPRAYTRAIPNTIELR